MFMVVRSMVDLVVVVEVRCRTTTTALVDAEEVVTRIFILGVIISAMMYAVRQMRAALQEALIRGGFNLLQKRERENEYKASVVLAVLFEMYFVCLSQPAFYYCVLDGSKT